MTYGDNLPEVQLPYTLAGAPTGPVEDFAYIGEQPTFAEPRPDLLAPSDPKIHLMHHVPVDMRGHYKLRDADSAQLGERLHQSGYAMCTATVNPNNLRALADNNGQPRACKAKAINRSGLCSRHGGMLHPLDRKQVDWENAPREIKWKFGKLDPSELDDEELSRGQIRKANGKFTSSNAISSEMHAEMVRRLFERADEKMRTHLLDMVDVFAEIAKGQVYEPADRLRAAENIWKWLRGGVPQKVEVGVDSGFEKLMKGLAVEAVSGGSRAEARAARGEVIEEEPLDAEVVDIVADIWDAEEMVAEAQEDDDEDDIKNRPTNIVEENERLSDDWVPEPVVSHGPAGKPYTGIPDDPEARERYEKTNAQHIKEAEDRRAEFKRQAKEHRDRIRKARARREVAKSLGETTLPAPIAAEVTSTDNEKEYKFHG